MNRTKIEWTDYTWNPVTGCTKVSQGCKNCYAEVMTRRFSKVMGDFRTVKLHPERLEQPIKVLKGAKIFVCDVSDLFHPDVPFEFIAQVFAVMALSPQHTFQILTKRPDRAVEYFKRYEYNGFPDDRTLDEIVGGTFDHLLYDPRTHELYEHIRKAGWFWDRYGDDDARLIFEGSDKPLSNIWIGTSCEDQETANERIPFLLQIPASVRFLSCEPLLGPIDISPWLYPKEFIGMDVESYDGRWHDKLSNSIHWVIVGGESGHKARPMHPDWVRSIRDQCAAADVPFFFKQWGEYMPFEQDPQPPFYRCVATSIIYDGHGMNHIDPETSEAGRWMGGRWYDPMDSISLCMETNSRDCTWLKLGKHKTGNKLDRKQHLEFPTLKK